MHIASRFTIVACLFSVLPSPAIARTWLVAPDGTGDVTTIRAGVDSAAAGDSVTVSPGVYLEWDIIVSRPIALVGLGAPSAVVMDAGNQGAGLRVSGVPAPGVRLHSLTFVNGIAFGGMLRIENSELYATECEFLGNPVVYDGWMISVHHSTASLVDCRLAQSARRGLIAVESDLALEGCHVEDLGQGVETRFGSVRISNTTFRNAEWGGGLSLRVSNAVVEGCLFESNHSFEHGGGLLASGGSLSLSDCTFRGNDTGSDGYGGNGGGANVAGASPAVVLRCTFESNEARAYGGGLLLVGGDIADCVFRDNSAGEYGGGLIFGGGDLTGSMFRGNVAGQLGGGAMFYFAAPERVERCLFAENTALVAGGGVMCLGWEIELSQCTLIANAAPILGSAIYLLNVPSGSTRLTNSIVMSSTGAPPVSVYPALTSLGAVECSDIFLNQAGDWVGPLAPWDGTAGNLSADPLFCNPFLADYHLRGGSPCLDENSGCGLIGAFDRGTCGVVGVRAQSWARTKALYRAP